MKRFFVFCAIIFSIAALTGSLFGSVLLCRAQEPEKKDLPARDLALSPISAEPAAAKYRDPSNIRYQTGPSITLSRGGRLWVSVMTGGRGEDNNNYVDLITSGDGGATWSEPKFALDIPGPMRTFDPAIWTDPTGKVWWFWCQVYDFWDGRGGLWAMTCDNPDKEDALWSPPRRLCDGVMKNKPTVTSHGEWWMLVEQWKHEKRWWHNQNERPDWYHSETKHIGANIYSSADKGKTWLYKSTAPVPDNVRTCDEHMAIELKDGSFRMLLRTLYGMGECRSTDQGQTCPMLCLPRLKILQPDSILQD